MKFTLKWNGHSISIILEIFSPYEHVLATFLKDKK